MDPVTSAPYSDACVNASPRTGQGILLTTPQGPLPRPLIASNALEAHEARSSPLSLSQSVRSALELRKHRLITKAVPSEELGQRASTKDQPPERLRRQSEQHLCKTSLAGKENMAPVAFGVQEKSTGSASGIVATARNLRERRTSSRSPSASTSQLGDLRNLVRTGKETLGTKTQIFVDPEFQPMFVNQAEFAMFCERTEAGHHEALAALKHQLMLAKSRQCPGVELSC